MQRISTCLWFDDQAEAAATFYVSLFPNSSPSCNRHTALTDATGHLSQAS